MGKKYFRRAIECDPDNKEYTLSFKSISKLETAKTEGKEHSRIFYFSQRPFQRRQAARGNRQIHRLSRHRCHEQRLQQKHLIQQGHRMDKDRQKHASFERLERCYSH